MPGSLKVNIFMPQYWTAYGGQSGQWAVDGGAWNDSGATVAGLADGDHTVSFYPVNPGENQPSIWKLPTPIDAVVTDGNTTITIATYATCQPESILESQCYGLEETPCYALNTTVGAKLFLAASSMDAAFSAYGPAVPGQQIGAAYQAAIDMGVFFEQSYQIMLEGGQEASDFLSAAELMAIAALVEPYLTGTGSELPGGVPVRCGYMLAERNVNSWVIQRGKGFSLQPAIDAGFVSGYTGAVNIAWNDPAIGSTPGPQQTVAGFAVAFNGDTFPDESPGDCEGMTGQGMWTALSPVSGYPVDGGGNVSQIGNIAGAVSIHTVNNDDTINAAFNWSTSYAYGAPPWGATYSLFPSVFGAETPDYTEFYYGLTGAVLESGVLTTSSYEDYFNPIMLHDFVSDYGLISDMPPAYYDGSPDWIWIQTQIYPPYPANGADSWGNMTLAWTGTNAQVLTVPLVIVFWIGTNPSAVPQITFTTPDAVGNIISSPPVPPPYPVPLLQPLNGLNQFTPFDRNARITETTNGTISPFNISLTNPPSASSYQLFNLQ